MADRQIEKFQFGLNGVVSKSNPTLLTNGQYRRLGNMEILQEGALATRPGKKFIGFLPDGSVYVYEIQKLPVVAESPVSLVINPSKNPRYVGYVHAAGVATTNLYRTLTYDSFELIAEDINTLANARTKGFTMTSYGAGESGGVWAFIASELKMLKDRGEAFRPGGPGPYIFPIPQWGILPAFGVALAADTGAAGNLDGGTQLSPNGSQPYDWRYCVAHDTPVLCADLKWRQAGELAIGQEIVSFDQDEDFTPRYGASRRACPRRYRTAHIVENSPAFEECFEIKTDIGMPVTATADHPWLVWSRARRISKTENPNWSSPSPGLVWKTTEELVPGDKLAHFGKPWEEDLSRDAGWLAGVFDGEGSAFVPGKREYSNPAGGASLVVSVAQNDGLVLKKVKDLLGQHSIKYCYSYGKRRSNQFYHVTITNIRDAIRFLGTIRPERLLENLRGADFLPGLKLNRTYDLAEIKSITPVGTTKIASIQTSNGTFITGGYLSHNTYINADTGNEGNPSQVMLPGSQAGVARPGDGEVATAVVNNGGAGWAIGDIGYIAPIAGSNGGAFFQVVAISGIVYGSGPINYIAISAGGNGYVIGDTGTIPGGDGTAAYIVDDVDGFGAVRGVHLTAGGNGYVDANGVAASGGSGAGFLVDIRASIGGSTGAASEIRLTSGGIGYTAGSAIPTVAFPPGAGSGLTVDITVRIPYSGSPLAVHQHSVDVTVWGTGDPQVSSIRIYRRGGLLYDTWRLVGQIANPGAGVTATFRDNMADADLLFQQQLELDNDAPVTSTVSIPIVGKMKSTAMTDTSPGRQTVAITAMVSGSLAQVRPGSTMHFFYGNEIEDVTVEAVDVGANTITAYFQFPHIIGLNGADWEIDAVAGQPCHLAITYGQFIVVAGDPNNPHLLYRSKGGRPEAFPVVPADNSVSSIACGTPANPVMGLANFRGTIVSLNRHSMFETVINQGSFVTPAQVANRGVVGKRAWCQTDNEIWFLSNDGVWSWDGGACRKRSEAIDPLFHGVGVDGLEPLDPSTWEFCVLESRRGQVYLIYQGVSDTHEIVCEPMFNDRWRLYGDTTRDIPLHDLYVEPDTQNMIECGFSVEDGNKVIVAAGDQNTVSGGLNYASDYYADDPLTQGDPIPFEVLLPWFDLGAPAVAKLFEEILLEITETGSVFGKAQIFVDVLTDFSETAVDTMQIFVPLVGRTLVSVLPQPDAGPPVASYGREARAFSLRIYGFAYPARISFWSLTIRYQPTGELTAGGSMDWMDLGYQHDKKLYQLILEFDVAGTNRTVEMDVLSGREGNVYTPRVQAFVLSNPVILGSGRALKSFPVNDSVGPVKMIRLRPVPDSETVAPIVQFKIQRVECEKEQYPPDVVSFTEWTTKGYEYQTFCNQVTVDVNTHGQAIIVQLQSDGATVFTFTVTTTEFDRQRRITVPTNITGYQWRLYVDLTQANLAPGSTGMFQLWGHSLKLQQADKGEVGHTFDWDELGHPWDKYLQTLTIEWDATGGADVTLRLDTLGGINGQVYTPAVDTFVLTGGRGRRVFPLNPDVIAKMVRVYPVPGPIPVLFKQWKYFFEKLDFPADIWRSTPWKHAEDPNDENPSWLWIDADTQGVPAAVQLRNEDGVVMAFTHTGTLNDRKRNYPIPVDIFAKQWRLIIAEGPGGKFQLFEWGFARWQPVPNESGTDPAEVILWTPWSDFGWMYDKVARNLILRANTGGKNVIVHLQTAEAGTVQTFTINQQYTDRPIHYACHSNLIGKMWRLVVEDPRPAGGLFQLWRWDLDAIREPAAIDHWDSYEQSLGYRGWKIVKQVWLAYSCESPVTFTILSDTGSYTQILPAHPQRTPQEYYTPDPAPREVERFYLPDAFSSGLNKSKFYRVVIDAATRFKFYVQSSGLEWLPCGGDRRASYQQMALSEFQTFGEGGAQSEAA